MKTEAIEISSGDVPDQFSTPGRQDAKAQTGGDLFGLRWQSAAPTPLLEGEVCVPKRRGASLPAAVHIFALMLLPLCLPAVTNDLTGALQRGLFEEEANRNLDAAAQAYQAVSAQFDKDRKLAATAIFRLGEVYRKQGRTNDAVAQYERIVREFPEEQTLVTLSRQNIAGSRPTTGKGGGSGSSGGSSFSDRIVSIVSRSGGSTSDATILKKIKGLSQAEARQILPTLMPDELLTKLLAQYQAAESARAEKSADFAPQHPDMVKFDALLKKLDEQIKGRIEGIVQALEIRVAAASAGAENAAQSPAATDDEEKEIRRIQAMIQNSPDLINAKSGEDNLTPLCRVAGKGQLRVAAFLLDHSADINLNSPLRSAASYGHKAMIELLLGRGAEVNAPDGEGQTPLHRAAAKGFLSVTRQLLEAKADPNLCDNKNRTPLTLAVQGGFRPVAAVLLARGANPNIIAQQSRNFVSSRDTDGAPLHFGVAKRDEVMVALLLTNKADVTLKSPLGESPLHMAAALGQPRIAAQLIAAGADVNAGASLSPNFTAPLSPDGGRYRQNVTPLMLAVGADSVETTTLLLEHKANPNLKDEHGQTALLLAISKKKAEMVKMLLAHGADPNLRDSGGLTPLIQAVVNQRDKGITAAVLEAKPDVNAPDSSSNTALYYAASAGELELVGLLLTARADANVRNLGGWISLHAAVANDQKPTAELLLTSKADVNARNDNGHTPLHIAAERGNKELVELLLTRGADPNVRDNQNKTPLDLVKSSLPRPGQPPGSKAPSRTEIAALLRQHGARDDLPALDRIQVCRPAAGFAKTIFSKGTNDWNQFTLFELIGVQYQFLAAWPGGEPGKRESVQLLAMNDNRSDALSFPDWAHVRLRRPASGNQRWQEQVVDVSSWLRSNDCSKDVVLQWGDEVIVPETDHPLGERWGGFAPAELKLLDQCLARQVEIIVKGQTTKIPVGPKFEDQGRSGPAYVVTKAPVWIEPVLRTSNLLLSSSDLSRVKVTRRAPASGKAREWILDCSGDHAPDLWLRDGDVVEVPDKP